MLSDNVRIWAREQKCLEALSEDREWRRSCDVSRQVVPYRGAGSCECATANCGSTNDQYVQAIRAGRTQSSWRHVCDASEAYIIELVVHGSGRSYGVGLHRTSWSASYSVEVIRHRPSHATGIGTIMWLPSQFLWLITIISWLTVRIICCSGFYAKTTNAALGLLFHQCPKHEDQDGCWLTTLRFWHVNTAQLELYILCHTIFQYWYVLFRTQS